MMKRVHRSMVTLTLFCLLHLLFFCVLSAMAEDVDNLISFKNSLPNPNLLSNWNRMHGVCEFQGVTCKGSHVSSLTIRGLSLQADFSSVSAHILSLGNLETLSLHFTNLTGSISTLANCTIQLRELDLSRNNLRGSLYDTTSLAASCQSLQSLNLSNNYIGQPYNHTSPVLRGLKMLDLSYNKITSNKDLQFLFSKLGLLNHLDLAHNNIQGTIPKITHCTFLQFLDLSFNELSSTVPAGTFSGCLNLTYLNLSSNHFTGKAPPDIEACTNLNTLSLSNNNFSGVSPVLSMVAMPRLQVLELAFNNFNGSLPKSISKFTSLKLLDLSANSLSGSIPRSLCTGSVSRLEVLYLQDNYFTGYIPDSLCNCTNLVSLDLSLNLLSGSIPNALGSLSNLKDLIMWQNNLHGEIPAELSSLKLLKNLLLDYNNLTGAIPDGLVNCTNLNWISLTSNRLIGSIPIWIGKLEKLVILILGNNSFTGSIPLGLGDCKGLGYLDLSSNQLNGSIPPALAKQSNELAADIAGDDRPYFSKRTNNDRLCHRMNIFLEFDGIRYNDMLRVPSISYCNVLQGYTARISRTNSPILRTRISLIFLDLSYNQLDGQIPIEISAMQSMTSLYLGHNHLRGPLPQELGDLASLIILDLSHNMLEGMIPSSFSALSLSKLDLSNNMLSGPIPEQGSLVTFPAYAFENNSGLCGVPLPPCNSTSTPKEDGSKKSSIDHGSSEVWWIALGLLFFIFLIIGFLIDQFLR